MRRFITLAVVVVAAAAAMLAGGAASGRAAADNCAQGSVSGTQTCTVTGPMSLELGPGCGFADAFINGNGVFHITVNKAGDAWVTGTIQGQFTVTDAGGNTVGTGHAVSWFGVEDNNQNGVEHFTANGSASLVGGGSVGFHVEGQFTMNANGVITVNRTTFSCR